MSEPNSKLFRDDPATYYAELGAKSERERIIKLLEEQITTCHENNLDESGQRPDWETYWDVRIQEFEVAIALIKGETE